MNWGYIAGYFDGEGSVAFHKSAHRGRTTFITWHNTHRASLDAMRAFMGIGTVYERRISAASLGKLRQYVLQISNKIDILTAIAAMEPFLIIKLERVVALRKHLIDNVDETRMVNFGRAVAVTTEDLTRMYVEQEMPVGEIARLVGVNHSAISREIRARGLEVRSPASTKGATKERGNEAKNERDAPQTLAGPTVPGSPVRRRADIDPLTFRRPRLPVAPWRHGNHARHRRSQRSMQRRCGSC